MADLSPTRTRLALLRAVDGGQVRGYPVYDSGFVDYFSGSGANGRRVTPRVEELMRAQWVCRGKPHRDSPTSDFTVELTALGRQWLEAGDG
jgi:hypothetical protein